MAKRRVLIVDDSAVFRKVMAQAFGEMEGYEVVGQAADGIEALAFLQRERVDLITLDMTMPRMDGLACVKAIRKAGVRARVLVFSATSRQGADAAIEAMSMGADDYAIKPDTTITGQSPREAVRHVLTAKLVAFWPTSPPGPTAATGLRTPEPALGGQSATTGPKPAIAWSKFGAQAVVIASSTGGPVALEKLFTALSRPFMCPVFLVQHMPPVFTASLAQRLGTLSNRVVREAVHGEMCRPGICYVCPGNYHMRLERRREGVQVQLDQTPLRNYVRPAADHLFETAAGAYGRKCLGIVLTGMGSDGRDGAVAIKKTDGAVAIQDQKSCVVFGMPKAVYDAGAYDFIGSIEDLASIVSQAAG